MLIPSGRGDVEWIVVVLADPVGPAVAAEVVPEILDSVEFWKVRRQWGRRDAARNFLIVAAIETLSACRSVRSEASRVSR